jgi:hypothetical protein
MCDVNIVSVDSRGRSSSDIDGYSNRACALSYFKRKVARHPNALCHKSEVAALCGMDLKVYFHKDDIATNNIQHKERINQAATLLTLDPATGFAKYHIAGVAYAVMNDGIAPLSMQQVWGMVELANSVSDYYQFDPDHQMRGRAELVKNCELYRAQCWGPLSIYRNREDDSSLTSRPKAVIARGET